MTALISIRKRLGINQQELATILGISRSALAMAESGQRKLAAESIVKLGRLEIGSVSSSRNAGELIPEMKAGEKSTAQDILEKKKTAVESELDDARKRMSEIEVRLLEENKRRKLLDAEVVTFSGIDNYTTQLKSHQKVSEKKTQKFTGEFLWRLQFEIRELENHLDFLKREIEQLK